MADENTELLKEIAALLKQQAEERQEQAEERQKMVGDALGKLRGPADWKKSQEEMIQRLKEAREKAEQNREELRAYQDSVLSEMRKISSLLEQMQRQSGGA